MSGPTQKLGLTYTSESFATLFQWTMLGTCVYAGYVVARLTLTILPQTDKLFTTSTLFTHGACDWFLDCVRTSIIVREIRGLRGYPCLCGLAGERVWAYTHVQQTRSESLQPSS